MITCFVFNNSEEHKVINCRETITDRKGMLMDHLASTVYSKIASTAIVLFRLRLIGERGRGQCFNDLSCDKQ